MILYFYIFIQYISYPWRGSEAWSAPSWTSPTPFSKCILNHNQQSSRSSNVCQNLRPSELSLGDTLMKFGTHYSNCCTFYISRNELYRKDISHSCHINHRPIFVICEDITIKFTTSELFYIYNMHIKFH